MYPPQRYTLDEWRRGGEREGERGEDGETRHRWNTGSPWPGGLITGHYGGGGSKARQGNEGRKEVTNEAES